MKSSKKILLVFLFVLTPVLLINANAQNSEYLVDITIDNNAVCSGNEAYTSITSFTDSDGSIAYLCVKKKDFIEGNAHVINAYFKENSQCLLGEPRGSFKGTDQNNQPVLINFCVVRDVVPAEQVASDVTIVATPCPQGFTQTSSVKILQITYRHCMVGGNPVVQEQTQSPGPEQNIPPPLEDNTNICEDEDPNNDIHKRGLIITSQNPDLSKYDECYSDTQTKEFRCINNNLDYVLGNCPSGEKCQEGICRVQTNEQNPPQNQQPSAEECQPRQKYGIGGIFGGNADKLCKRHGEEYVCNPNEPPACTELGQFLPWNWFSCNINPTCDRRFIGVDLMITCCPSAIGSENEGNGGDRAALGGDLGRKVIAYLETQNTPDSGYNPGMVNNLKSMYNSNNDKYILEPDFQNSLLNFLSERRKPDLRAEVATELNNNPCSEVECGEVTGENNQDEENCNLYGMPGGFSRPNGNEVCNTKNLTCVNVIRGNVKDCRATASLFGCKECVKCCSS